MLKGVSLGLRFSILMNPHPVVLLSLLRLGCGRAGRLNSTFWRGLFERSEFRSHLIWRLGEVYPQGRARAEMVLGPFAETKGPRGAGAKPRMINF